MLESAIKTYKLLDVTERIALIYSGLSERLNLAGYYCTTDQDYLAGAKMTMPYIIHVTNN